MDASNRFNELEQSLVLIGEYLKAEMIAELVRQGHKITGGLINSITTEINNGTDYIQLDGAFVYYGRFVDTGRRAGAKRVPIDVLVEWIKAKGFQASAEQTEGKNFNVDKWRKGLAFAIQKTIFDKGISTSASWKGESTKNWMTGTLERNEKRIEKDVFEATEITMELIINNMLLDIQKKSNNKVTVK